VNVADPAQGGGPLPLPAELALDLKGALEGLERRAELTQAGEQIPRLAQDVRFSGAAAQLAVDLHRLSEVVARRAEL
jgi:hypothetical protein